MALVNSWDAQGNIRLLTAQGNNVYPGSNNPLPYFGFPFVSAGLGQSTPGNAALQTALQHITGQSVPNANFDNATVDLLDQNLNLFTPDQVVRLADILKLDLSVAQQACPVDLTQLLGNSGYESGLAQWTATKPNKTYQVNAPAVNPTIVRKGTTTALRAPAGKNFVGILNSGDTDISGKLAHTVVAGAVASGTTFEVTIFANRGRLAGANTGNVLIWAPAARLEDSYRAN
jgi:hypothetical protein